MRQVVLMGLMGSGKSTVGALVAPRTGRMFVDVDVVIAARTGKTVRELWEEGGEPAYRRLESEAVLGVLRDTTPTVLAAPAGVVLDPLVRTELAQSFVVWLRARPSTLASRVRPGDHRPLLGDRPAETLAAMAEARDGLYRQVATMIVDTDDLTPEG
jgi:shikimate kinase